jgi:nitroreductase
MTKPEFIPLNYIKPDYEEIQRKAGEFFQCMSTRRSVRSFSGEEIPENVLHNLIMTAGSAPSGAHKQPWSFCVVTDPHTKQQIRQAAEKEEYENYHGRMSDEWLKDLEKFDTDWHKEFLTKAPALIIIFKKAYDILPDGSKSKNYYVNESVGIAAGLLISAIHQAGLVTLTHTPSPMNFLQELLHRPENERAFLLLPVGYPVEGAMVPALTRKSAKEILFWYGPQK